MKRSVKTVVVVGLLLAVLAIICWLAVPGPQQQGPSPRLSITGFTNNIAGKRVAILSITNGSLTPLLFGLFVELPAKDGNYERWAAGAPEKPPTALPAGGIMELQTEVPNPGAIWRLNLVWQPKPSRMGLAYARGVDGVLGILRKSGYYYPEGWVPSAHIWHHTTTEPDMARERVSEPIASPNAAPPHQ